jgi:hypothetical protein
VKTKRSRARRNPPAPVHADSGSQANIDTAPSTALANVLALPSVTTTTTGMQLSESMPIEEWLNLGGQIGRIGGAVQWWLGDWWLFGQERQWEWGEGRAVVEAAGVNYQTAKQYGSVAAAFELCDRSHNLSFTHHLVAMAAPATERQRWLSRAEKKGWSVSRLRAEIRQAEEKATAVTDDRPEERSTAEEDWQEPIGNDIDPTESGERTKAEHAAAEIEEEPEEETAPDQAADAIEAEDESAEETSDEEDREYFRHLAIEGFLETDNEYRENVRNFVLEEHYAQASGVDILNRVPADRLHDVARDFLGGLKALSPEFGVQLRALFPEGREPPSQEPAKLAPEDDPKDPYYIPPANRRVCAATSNDGGRS